MEIKNVASQIGWGVFIVRLLISGVSTFGIAMGVSFIVSDYIIEQRFSSIETTLKAVQSSVDASIAASAATQSSVDASIAASAATQSSVDASIAASSAAQSSVDTLNASTSAANSLLHSVIKPLNQSVQDNTAAMYGITTDQGILTTTIAAQKADIGDIKIDVLTIKAAVLEAGINIASIKANVDFGAAPFTAVFADKLDAGFYESMASDKSLPWTDARVYKLVEAGADGINLMDLEGFK